MHDRAVTCGYKVDYLAHRSGFLVTGDNKSPGVDLTRITGFIEKGPDVACLVLIVQISGDIYQVHLQASPRPGSLPAFAGWGCTAPRASSSSPSS
jgi:hypothetical protein